MVNVYFMIGSRSLGGFGGRVWPGALGGPWAQIWCTRGERILHDRIHVESVTSYYKLTNFQTYKLTNL